MEYPQDNILYPYEMDFQGQTYHAQWRINGNQVEIISEYGSQTATLDRELPIQKDENGNFYPPSPVPLLFVEILQARS